MTLSSSCIQTIVHCASRVEVKCSTYVRAIHHRWIKIVAVANSSSASPFIRVQIVNGAESLVVASVLFRQCVVCAIVSAWAAWIHIDFVVNVSLNEVRQLSVCSFGLIVAVPHIATQSPNEIFRVIGECSKLRIECRTQFSGPCTKLIEILFQWMGYFLSIDQSWMKRVNSPYPRGLSEICQLKQNIAFQLSLNYFSEKSFQQLITDWLIFVRLYTRRCFLKIKKTDW